MRHSVRQILSIQMLKMRNRKNHDGMATLEAIMANIAILKYIVNLCMWCLPVLYWVKNA